MANAWEPSVGGWRVWGGEWGLLQVAILVLSLAADFGGGWSGYHHHHRHYIVEGDHA